MCPWIKIVPNCPMPDLHTVVLVMHTNADDPTCALLINNKKGMIVKPVWVYDQTWEDIESGDGTEVTHWAAITLPESNTKDV